MKNINELAELKACYSAFGKARTKRITKHVEARFKTFRDGGSNPPASIRLYSRQLLFFKMCQFRTGISILQVSRRHHLLIILILGTFFAVCPAKGSIYFVDPNGNDSNSGTIGSPFKTIPQAVSVVAAGDTIYVRGGTHIYTTTITISKSGTAGAKYYMFAYPGERPILDFSGMADADSNRGVKLTGSYWYIKGLNIYKGCMCRL